MGCGTLSSHAVSSFESRSCTGGGNDMCNKHDCVGEASGYCLSEAYTSVSVITTITTDTQARLVTHVDTDSRCSNPPDVAAGTSGAPGPGPAAFAGQKHQNTATVTSPRVSPSSPRYDIDDLPHPFAPKQADTETQCRFDTDTHNHAVSCNSHVDISRSGPSAWNHQNHIGSTCGPLPRSPVKVAASWFREEPSCQSVASYETVGEKLLESISHMALCDTQDPHTEQVKA